MPSVDLFISNETVDFLLSTKKFDELFMYTAFNDHIIIAYLSQYFLNLNKTGIIDSVNLFIIIIIMFFFNYFLLLSYFLKYQR